LISQDKTTIHGYGREGLYMNEFHLIPAGLAKGGSKLEAATA